MDTSILEVAGSLGVGAFLAVIIFIMYRRDRQASENRLREDRRFMEDRLTLLLEKDQTTRGDNTKALTELIVLITRLNGRK